MKYWYVFTGGYSEPTPMASGEIVPGQCKGVSCYRLDGETGRMELLTVSPSVPNPSCVLAAPGKEQLFCVSELGSVGGLPGAAVAAYAIDRKTGSVTQLNTQATTGADACHLALSPSGTHLLCANYSGGSVAVFPVEEDGSLGTASCVLKHQGSSADPDRQTSPHPHQILMAPDGEHVYVSDLGMDRVVCYRADWNKGWLLPQESADILGKPGQGTRHGVFSRDGRFFYLMCELTAEVNVYEKQDGGYELVQTLSARLEDLPWLGAAIRLHPNGRLLFCSVRRSNHLSVFRVEENGRLTLLRQQTSGGEIPRDFDLTPDGNWLLAAHQDTHSICVFSVNGETGELTSVWNEQGVGSVTSVSIWDPDMR